MAHLRFDDPPLLELRLAQDGVLALWQLFERGARWSDVERMVRRRELRQVFPGIYVDHTGHLTARQREWIAVLTAWPAALAAESALPGVRTGVVHIAVKRGRRNLQLPPYVRMQRVTDLEELAMWHRSPPRLHVEPALLQVMSRRIHADDVAAAFDAMARVLHERATTVDRVLEALARRRRISGRATIESMLTDARDGACSVLERGYLRRVERAHGLPLASRQHPSTATGKLTHQDVRYPAFGLVLELDGFTFHGTAQARDDDAERDLAELAASSAATARLTYGLVFSRQCRTAKLIATILQREGWDGRLQACPRCPDTLLRRR